MLQTKGQFCILVIHYKKVQCIVPPLLANFMEHGLLIKDKLSRLNNFSVSRKFLILYVTASVVTMFTRAHILGHLIPIYTFTPQVSQIHLKITYPIWSLPLHPDTMLYPTHVKYVLHISSFI